MRVRSPEDLGRANRLLEHELRVLRRLGAEIWVDFRDRSPGGFEPDESADDGEQFGAGAELVDTVAMSFQDLIGRLDRTANDFHRELIKILRSVTCALVVGDAVALDGIGLRRDADGMESVVLAGEIVPRMFWSGETESRRGFGGVHDLGRPEMFTAECFVDEFARWGISVPQMFQIIGFLGTEVYSLSFIHRARSEFLRYLSGRSAVVGKWRESVGGGRGI